MNRWVDDICSAFEELGNEASFAELYLALRRIRPTSLVGAWKATVRRVVQDFSRDSASFRGVHLFSKVAFGRWRFVGRTMQPTTVSVPQEENMTDQLEFSPYEEFRDSWLESVQTGATSTVQLGNRFAEKIVKDWLDADDAPLDVIYCDGSGDGGIDIAILDSASASNDDDVTAGDTWYLVQSKYGTALSGVSSVLVEGQKVIDSLDGSRKNLSSLGAAIIERLANFRQNASPQDRIVLTFATIDPLSTDQQRALTDLQVMGRNRIGAIFDVESISLRTIYNRLVNEQELASTRRLTVNLRGNLGRVDGFNQH